MKNLIFVLLFIATSGQVTSANAETANETFCKAKWTEKTGFFNTRMYDSCLEELNASDRELAEFLKQHENESWFRAVARPGCDEKWTHDGRLQPEMAIYCYRQELAAFTELQYQSHLPSFNSACAEACYNVWKTKPGSALSKTFECYRARAEAPRPSLPKLLQRLMEPAATEPALNSTAKPASS